MGMNQNWTPPIAASDWLMHSPTVKCSQSAGRSWRSEFLSSGLTASSPCNIRTDGKSIDECGIVHHLFAAHRQFRTSSSTQHVERGWCPDLPDRLVLLNCCQHDSASEHDPGGHDARGERTGASWAPVTHIHQPAGVKGLKLTSVTEI